MCVGGGGGGFDLCCYSCESSLSGPNLSHSKYSLYTDNEKGRAATRVVKMSAEKTVIHNPHPGTNTKVSIALTATCTQ